VEVLDLPGKLAFVAHDPLEVPDDLQIVLQVEKLGQLEALALRSEHPLDHR